MMTWIARLNILLGTALVVVGALHADISPALWGALIVFIGLFLRAIESS